MLRERVHTKLDPEHSPYRRNGPLNECVRPIVTSAKLMQGPL